MSIQRLPEGVAVQIKSSAAVTSLNGTICGLLQNALDAQAKRVAVSVNYGRGSCDVDDDGVGISSAEFQSDGGLGKLHYTSKFPRSPTLHGWQGSFLASVASLSLLSVVSRCAGHEQQDGQSYYHYQKPQMLTIHNGKVLLRRHASTASEQGIFVPLHGTRVTVHDLFGCMPVRARMRPTPDTPAWGRDWDELLRAVAALLLAWPQDIVVTIRESKDDGGDSSVSRNRRTRAVTLRSTLSSSGREGIVRSMRLLAQASLRDTADAMSWVRVGASAEGLGLSINGCIGLTPVASKRAQFIRIDIHPLSADHQAKVLYDEVNRIFSESNFSITKDANRGSGSKNVDRWPMFVFGIDLAEGPVNGVDAILNDQGQHLPAIIGLFRTVLAEFLSKHGFYGEIASSQNADDGTKIDGVKRARSDSEGDEDAERNTAAEFSRSKRQKSNRGGQPLVFQLPVRRKNTGKGYPFSAWGRVKAPASADGSERPINPVCASQLNMDGLVLDEAKAVPETNKEISKFFSARNQCELPESANSKLGTDRLTKFDSNMMTSGETRISRDSLSTAEVVGQVDQKFILIKSTQQHGESESGSLLIMVDQHAADERCEVEKLLQGYFVQGDTLEWRAETAVLETPLQFHLPASERELLARKRNHFQHWGVFYDVLDSDGTYAVTLKVFRLPAVISKRCGLEPKLVVDMIRQEIWKPATLPATREGKAAWVSRMHGCPQGILDLLNSKACHSAIRFNDKLSHQECVDLLDRLLRCAFPFQCAHGRPSMVPLINLASTVPELASDDKATPDNTIRCDFENA